MGLKFYARRCRTLAITALLSISLTAAAQRVLVKPYLQPGNAPDFSREEKVIIWETDSVSGSYEVAFKEERGSSVSRATITSSVLRINQTPTFLYRAILSDLKFDTKYEYTVKLNGKRIGSATFRTRSKKNNARFIVFGDMGVASKEQSRISRMLSKRDPDLIISTGDNVYSKGLRDEYFEKFFPFYQDLMTRVPFYMAAGNHDVGGGNLDSYPGGLAYFYYNDLPLNAPKADSALRVHGSAERVDQFIRNATPRFPTMLNFSFDHGNVHFTFIDSNPYVNPLDGSVLAWLRTDLAKSTAEWKIVIAHHPPFNSGKSHYDYQTMRLLAPVLEELGVDLVISGHVHNYQRTVPLSFQPVTLAKEGSGKRRVNGEFVLDTSFDGQKDTSPSGIIYIVSGAGGAPLYDRKKTDNPPGWKHEPEANWVPFTTRFIANTHSFTWIETDGRELRLQQIDGKGRTLDEIKISH